MGNIFNEKFPSSFASGLRSPSSTFFINESMSWKVKGARDKRIATTKELRQTDRKSCLNRVKWLLVLCHTGGCSSIQRSTQTHTSHQTQIHFLFLFVKHEQLVQKERMGLKLLSGFNKKTLPWFSNDLFSATIWIQSIFASLFVCKYALVSSNDIIMMTMIQSKMIVKDREAQWIRICLALPSFSRFTQTEWERIPCQWHN